MTVAESTLRAIAEELGLSVDVTTESGGLRLQIAVCDLKAKAEQFRGANQWLTRSLAEQNAGAGAPQPHRFAGAS